MLVIFLAIYNAFVIPLQIGFDPQVFKEPYFIFLDVFVDCFFAFDILVSFNTTFYNNEGTEIYTRKDIAVHYVSGGRFFIDFMSTVPL